MCVTKHYLNTRDDQRDTNHAPFELTATLHRLQFQQRWVICTKKIIQKKNFQTQR